MSGRLQVPDGEDRPSLSTLLARAGIGPGEAERLRGEGNLGLAIVDRALFPDPPRYTTAQLGELTGLGEEVGRWSRAFGLPDPTPGEIVYGDADVEVFRFVHDLVSANLSAEERTLSVNRVLGGAMAKLAAAIVDTLHDRLVGMATDDDAVVRFAVETSELTVEALPVVLQYVWRKHLRVAMRRALSQPTAAAGMVAVGFADLVGFTILTQQLAQAELGAVLTRFESTVLDLVSAYGGRVVKHIGDEAMFAFDDPTAAVEVGLRLCEIHHFDETLPALRVGIAYGEVLAREGDLYGPTVNRASRIVPLALPGTVLVDDRLERAIAGVDRLEVRPLHTGRHLKGIGPTDLAVVRWADEAAPERVRDLLAQRYPTT